MTDPKSSSNDQVSPMDRLIAAMDRAGNVACVGIDPVVDRFDDAVPGSDDLERMRSFCMGALESASSFVGVVKPQSACFERYGAKGYQILEEVVDRARQLNLIVILDAKRGDIGSSATHYAVGASSMGADFITVSPYMGRSTIQPFLDAGLGVFGLCRTSNPDADELQCLAVESGGGGGVHLRTAKMLCDLGDQVGAVVGATNSSDEVRAIRDAMPDGMFLVPGVGAQGGTIDDVRSMTRPHASSAGQLGVVINASRSVLYPTLNDGEGWESGIARASEQFGDQCSKLLG